MEAGDREVAASSPWPLVWLAQGMLRWEVQDTTVKVKGEGERGKMPALGLIRFYNTVTTFSLKQFTMAEC